MFKVLVTGPESSGKSYLVKALSKHFKGKAVWEYAREFLSNRNSYVKDDLLTIANKQYDLINNTFKLNERIVFCDTGIEVIKIWSKEKFGNIDHEIIFLEESLSYDLVLLCKPNIPWVYDELRENENDTDRLFELYHVELSKRSSQICIIDEELINRKNQAIDFVTKYLEI